MAQTVCPKCGSTNVGTSTAHKLKKGATYAADFALENEEAGDWLRQFIINKAEILKQEK